MFPPITSQYFYAIHYFLQSGVEFEDPVRFVIRTWPWQEEAEGLPQALLKVKTETSAGTDPVKTDINTDSEDPLVR